MEEVLSIVGFSFGASLGIGAVRSVTAGTRPILRGLVKGGIRVMDAIGGAASTVREDAAQTPDEASSRGRGRRRAEPRKIEIAHE